MRHKLLFRLERETKGTFVYKEVDEKGNEIVGLYAVGTLYLRKYAIGKGKTTPPEALTVTVTD